MRQGYLSNASIFSLTYNLPYWFYKFMKGCSMGEVSSQVEKRLAMIEFYYQIKDVVVASSSFKISRKTFYKWLKRYEQSGKKLSSLEDQPKAPLVKRKINLNFNTELKD